MKRILVSGGTGYMGARLIPELLRRGYEVRALVRPGSEKKLPNGCDFVRANVLDGKSYAHAADGCDTLVHLVGVAHPSPAKAQEFRSIDLKSVEEMIPVARNAGVEHVVYLSVAHPAPIMKAYWQTREEAEALIRQQFSKATFLRPWYVLGPGHRWAYALKPLYAFWKAIPSTRQTALRLDLVSIEQMTRALVHAVEHTPTDIRIMEAQEIKVF